MTTPARCLAADCAAHPRRPLACGHPIDPDSITYYPAGARITVGDRTITMTGREPMTTGYAILARPAIAPATGRRLRKGARVCYACADDMQRRDIETADALTAYDTGGATVTTWTGGHLAYVIARSVTGRRGNRRTALTVRTSAGRILHGRYGSDWSQAVTLRPAKHQPATQRANAYTSATEGIAR